MAGDVIAGRYTLLEPLGRGAMSSVWLAEDAELGRRVAVKVLGPNADRARFDREARAAAALSHPHICQLYDYGEDAGRAFMVLEYLPGGTLEDRLRAEKLSDDDASRIADELAAGLEHAHARGLVHRDLKPANVLFDAEGRAKIADFGIARMGGSGTLTEAGSVLGTASYISPEQADGRTATPASDVYSFGVILFRILTGRLPFVSTNAMELVRMHRDETPPPVSAFRPDAPARLERVAAASLAKDPAERPANGAALVEALSGGDDSTAATLPAAGTEPFDDTGATRVVPRRPRARPSGPLVPILIIAAIALLVAGGAVALFTMGDGGESSETTTSQASLTIPTVPPSNTTTRETTTAETTTPSTTHATTTRPRTITTLPTATTATSPLPPPPTTTVVSTTTPATTSTTTDTTTVATTTVGTVP